MTTHPKWLYPLVFLFLFAGNATADQILDVPLAGVDYGDAEVQFSLGLMFDTGRDAPQDYAEALRWYRKSAAQGYAQAQYALGVLYANGHGVPQDDREAVHWYTRSAERGFAPAQYNLGFMYHKGRGTAQDYREALKWYTKAALQGYADAQSNLGTLHYHGQGVPQNYVQAYAWLSVAAANGDEVAATNRDAVMEDMTAEQIAKGQEIARELFEKVGPKPTAPSLPEEKGNPPMDTTDMAK